MGEAGKQKVGTSNVDWRRVNSELEMVGRVSVVEYLVTSVICGEVKLRVLS